MSPKGGARSNPHSQRDGGQYGLHGLCTAGSPTQLRNSVPSIQLLSLVVLGGLLCLHGTCGLVFGTTPKALLRASTECLGNTSHLVSSHAQQLLPSSRSFKTLSLHYNSFIALQEVTSHQKTKKHSATYCNLTLIWHFFVVCHVRNVRKTLSFSY